MNFSYIRVTVTIFWPEIWQQGNGSIHIWQCMAHTWRCYHQIAVNLQVSLVRDKKTTHHLNQSFVILLRCKEENMEDRQTDSTKYSYKLSTIFRVVPTVVYNMEGGKCHWHQMTCYSLPRCTELLLKCPCKSSFLQWLLQFRKHQSHMS